MRLFGLIDAEKANYSISLLCRVLWVSRSGYYDWKDRPLSKRARENAALIEKIREIHERSRRIYGYPRVHAELRALGVRCSRKRVARLMRKASLQGCRRGRKKHTTRRDVNAIPAPDLLKRSFTAESPDSIWTSEAGHHLHPHSRGLPLSGLHPGCLLQEDSWLVDGEPPENRACGGCS